MNIRENSATRRIPNNGAFRQLQFRRTPESGRVSRFTDLASAEQLAPFRPVQH
jgi:hypothetical protein